MFFIQDAIILLTNRVKCLISNYFLKFEEITLNEESHEKNESLKRLYGGKRIHLKIALKSFILR